MNSSLRNLKTSYACELRRSIFRTKLKSVIESDNRIELTNKILNAYLAEIEVIHLYGSPNYPKNQGALEASNKKEQSYLSAKYYKAKDENGVGFKN